jgi:uncharacterized protein YneF (UPF0154 family)
MHLVDGTLAFLVLIEALFIAVGTFLAFRVSRLADHPPLGWILLTFSFATALLRAVCFFIAYALTNVPQETYIYAGQVLGLPIVVLVFFGVFFLYRDFTRQLRQRQSELIAPGQ